MNFQRWQARILVLLLCSVASVSGLKAQTQAQGEAAYHVKRQQAMQLFAQDKRLQALPLLEELVQQNPKDDEVLVALAASLVHHAATLTDQQQAGRERFRARNLVQEALDFGNSSPLAHNLRQLLQELPANGAIQFSDNPAVEQAMVAGEAAFSRHDFAEALKDYGKALELDPKNYAAILFTGNTYHRQGDVAKAGEWYERAIQLDPNTETAYRYYAEMLVKQGDMAKARMMLIRAVVAEPYNRIVWRDLMTWAALNNTKLNFKYAGAWPDPAPLKQPDVTAPAKSESLFDVKLFPERPRNLSDAWRAYDSVRESWKNGVKFKQQFPQEAEYRHSLAEESDALTAEVRVLEKLKGDIETAEPIMEDPSLSLLLKLYQAGVLEAYVLFRLGDEGIARDYSAYRAANRDKLEEYMDKFVVPPAPGKAN